MKLNWPHVALVTVLVAGMVVLSVFDKDTTAYIALASAVLLGAGITAGIHQQGEIKQATNGNSAALVELVAEMTRLLAAMTPPAQPPAQPVAVPDADAEPR